MTLEAVIALLSGIVDQLEDATIERDSLVEILQRAKFSREDIEHVWSDAKSDTAIRSKAHLAFADLRQRLEQAGILVALAGPQRNPPTPDKVN